MNRELTAAHIGFVVVVHPVPAGFAPAESAWYPIAKEFEPPYDMQPDAAATRELEDAVARSGVPAVDLQPAFTAEERAPNHVPLFGSADYHFTARARALVASALAARLDAMAPWSRAAAR